MIHTLRRHLRDATCEACSQPSAAMRAASFEAAVAVLRAASWHVTMSGRTYCPACAVAQASPSMERQDDSVQGGTKLRGGFSLE
jgi:hypothetical protein